jgi:hypothetical protein
MAISVKMLKNKPRIPQPNGVAPLHPCDHGTHVRCDDAANRDKYALNPFQDDAGRRRSPLFGPPRGKPTTAEADAVRPSAQPPIASTKYA